MEGYIYNGLMKQVLVELLLVKSAVKAKPESGVSWTLVNKKEQERNKNKQKNIKRNRETINKKRNIQREREIFNLIILQTHELIA